MSSLDRSVFGSVQTFRVHSLFMMSQERNLSDPYIATLFGLRRVLFSVFQCAYQFWASVRREFRVAWALLPFAKSELSRPWDAPVHAADASLSGMGFAALTAPLTVVKNAGSISERWRFKGPMRATSELRSALDEEVGPSSLDLLNLTLYLALCPGTHIVFPEVLVELYAAREWRVLCAQRWKRSERIIGLKCEAALWTFRAFCRKSQFAKTSTLNSVRQYVMGVRSQQRSVINLVSRPACTRIVWSQSGLRCQCSLRWFPSERNQADEPPQRFEWLTPNSRLPRRCLSLDE